MINIFNKFYSSNEYAYTKTPLYSLIYSSNKNPAYSITRDARNRCIIFVHVDVVDNVDDDMLDDVIVNYKKCKGNKIIVDTSLEEFVKEPYYHCVDYLVNNGVDHDDINILAGQTATSLFVNDYKIPFTTFSINTFETAYYNHLANFDMEFDFLERPEIKPRKIDRYFTSLTKNARFIRKVFHAFMVQKNYIEGNVYSFHNIGATPFNHYDLGWAKRFNLINDGISDEQWLAEVSSPYYVDDIDFVGEWNFNDEVSTTGINLTHETHAFVDMAGIKLNKIEIFDRVFLTEKTYKNFYHGLPYLSPGIPRQSSYIQQLGYRSFESLFNTTIDNTGYISCFMSYFGLIDEIMGMKLEHLEQVINSEECLDKIRHNQEVFFEQNEFKKLVSILETIVDKY